jgi:hypothetical protein
MGPWMTTNRQTDSPSSCGIPLSLLEKVAERLEHELLSDLLIRKLGKHGIGVTTRQRTRLTKWLEQGANGELPLPQAKRVADDVKLTFTPRDQRRLKGRMFGEMTEILAFSLSARRTKQLRSRRSGTERRPYPRSSHCGADRPSADVRAVGGNVRHEGTRGQNRSCIRRGPAQDRAP